MAVGSSWRVAVIVTAPSVAPAVTVALVLPAASVGPPATRVASPTTVQLMVTPAAGMPLLSAFTCSGRAKAVFTSAFWPPPEVAVRVATKATLASKATLISSPLAGMPSGS